MEENMRRGILLWVSMLLIACLGSAHAFQLAYKDTAGTVRWYQNNIAITGNVNVQPMNQTIRMNGMVKFISCEKVLDVNADGMATIQTEITDGSVTMNFPGTDQPSMNLPMGGMKITYKRTPTGKVSDMKIEGQNQAMMGMQGMNMADQWKMFSNTGQGFELPVGEILAGARWTNESSVEVMPGQKVTIKLNNLLQGPQVIDKVTYLQIDTDFVMNAPMTKMQIPIGDGQTMTMNQSIEMKAKMNTLFDDIAGELNRTWLSGTMNMKMSMPMPGSDQTITSVVIMNMSGGMNKIPPPAPKPNATGAVPPAATAK
jgi:hypothetical protein